MSLDFRIDHAQVFTGDLPGAADAPIRAGAMRSVGIAGDRLVLGVSPATPADRVIDATDLACAPGRIVLRDRAVDQADVNDLLRAGVSTAVTVADAAAGLDGLMHEIDRRRLAMNVALLIGYAQLRRAVGGEDQPLLAAQRRAIARGAERAMRAGCFGLSVPGPGEDANDSSLRRVLAVVDAHGGASVVGAGLRLDRLRRPAITDLPATIHEHTALPASALGLRRRGRIRHGHAADLMLFDPDQIDPATGVVDGVAWLFVNGRPVISSQDRPTPRLTHQRPGRLLRFGSGG